mmetsp:Transcript_2660/g.4569  ORF Transcript_2660/g.4569 Transcript_2660/m.4569 type:complete len:215 (-) Transcript_2660:770-1414(-)
MRTILDDLIGHDGVGLHQQPVPSQTLVEEAGVGFLHTIEGAHLNVDTLIVELFLEEGVEDGEIFIGARPFRVLEFEERAIIRSCAAIKWWWIPCLWLGVTIALSVHGHTLGLFIAVVLLFLIRFLVVLGSWRWRNLPCFHPVVPILPFLGHLGMHIGMDEQIGTFHNIGIQSVVVLFHHDATNFLACRTVFLTHAVHILRNHHIDRHCIQVKIA